MRSRSFPSFRGFGILPNKQFSPGQAAAEPGENTEVWLHFLCLLRFFFYYYYGEKCNFAKTPRTKRKTPQTIKFATLTKGT
jgi:hypothetical protein